MKEHKNRVLINARLTVQNSSRLSNTLIRICFSSDKPLPVDPLWIGPHLKLLFPQKNGEISFPQFNEQNKIIWQEGERERIRTYSIRDYNVETQQLTIDFVIHQSGVATLWAQQAKVGEQVGLIGLGAKYKFDEIDLNNQNLVLIGDLSALPAISYTIENLPQNGQVTAFIEIAAANEIIDFPNKEQVTVNWLIREAGQPSRLVESVTNYSFANRDKLFFWGGIEGSIAQQMRHALKAEYPDLDEMQIISYWREGFAEGEFRHRE